MQGAESRGRLLLPCRDGAQGRTGAGLAGQAHVAPEHVAETIQYRSLARAPRH